MPIISVLHFPEEEPVVAHIRENRNGRNASNTADAETSVDVSFGSFARVSMERMVGLTGVEETPGGQN